ncbi:putative transcription factor interactor and regulator CCHC(Zn) family protein, partial [Tanacetum coccineum]
VQEPEYDVNPDDLDVIDNDNFESGTDSDDDGIEKVRRKKLKQIKRAKESEDNIMHKHFFFVGQTFASADDVKERVRLHSIKTRRQLYLAKNDKVRIRAKCFGRNSSVYTRVVKVLVVRGLAKPLVARDECPWAVQITKVKNSETWEDQVEKNPDIPIRALQEELQRKYELGVSRQKAFRAKAAAQNQLKEYYKSTKTMLRITFRIEKGQIMITTIKNEVERDIIRKWELTGIPCSHAIAANYNMSLNGVQVGIPEEWVDKCYWLATWQKTYSYTIGCLNGRVMWKKSQIPTTLTPPKHNTPVGRPRKNRRKSKEEKAEMVKDGKLSRAYKTVTCMKCGNLGHNSRSCKGQKDPYTVQCSKLHPQLHPAKKPSDART